MTFSVQYYTIYITNIFSISIDDYTVELDDSYILKEVTGVKRIYYGILALALFLLLQPIVNFTIIDENRLFYAPYEKEGSGEVAFFSSPYVEEKDKEKVYQKLDELAVEFKLTLYLQSFDYDNAIGSPLSEDSILMFCSTGKQERLDELPFRSTPSVETYSRSTELYTSLSSSKGDHRLSVASRKLNYILGRLSLYQGSLQNGRLFIMDTDQENIDAFVEKVKASTGIALTQMEKQSVPFAKKKSSSELYRELIGIAFGGRRLLLLGTVGISMALVYLNKKKRWSILRLLGYSSTASLGIMAKEFILPTVLVSALGFIPFCLILGLDPTRFLVTAKTFSPVFLIFILYQMLILFVFILDQLLGSPLQTLQRKKNHKVLLGFSVLYKAVAILLIFPVLTSNLLIIGNLFQRYRFLKESRELYEDVWVLNATEADTLVHTVDVKGNKRGPADSEQLPWMKAFYDTIRDKYPVLLVLAGQSKEKDHFGYSLFLVNGNFVRHFGLKDKDGQALLPDNEEKMILATEDRYDILQAVFHIADVRQLFLGESTQAFAEKKYLDVEDYSDTEIQRVAEDSSILTFVDNFDQDTPKGWIQSFSLGVNALYHPRTLESLRFIGITEEQREQLLEDVSFLPYVDQLKWESYASFQSRLLSYREDENREILFDFVSTLITIFFLTLFLYYAAYDWMAQRWAVKYLLGMDYLFASLPLLGVLLSVNVLAFLFVSFFSSNPDFLGSNVKVLGLFTIMDIMIFMSVHALYKNNTIKNLTMRE